MKAIPRRSWFLMQPPSHLHGLGHTARVMVWAAVLTRETEWFEPVVWAAACHDLRRESDGYDLDHGFRAGTWVRDVLPGKLRQPLAHLERIARACDWHVCRDRDAGWNHPVLWWLKDADGLDRVRLFDLDATFLRHKDTRSWIAAANRLFLATRDLNEPHQIWKAALDQGLPVGDLIDFVDEQLRYRLEPGNDAAERISPAVRVW